MSGPSLFRRHIAHDRLQFEELFQPSLPPFSAVARLFEAPKTASEVDPRAINMNVAGSNTPGDPACPLQISRGHKPGQSIRGIVRDSDSVGFIFIRDDAKSASSRRMLADLPPSSCITRFTVGARKQSHRACRNASATPASPATRRPACLLPDPRWLGS